MSNLHLMLLKTTKPWFNYWHLTSLLILSMLCLFIAALSFGSVTISLAEIKQSLLLESTNHIATNIIWHLRLPRAILALLVGIHFALAGLILQIVVRNPLADPSVIGVNGGASLAIVICLLLADYIKNHFLPMAAHSFDLAWLPLMALIGGVAASTVVLKLSWKMQLRPSQLALNGIAVGAILNALVMWLILAWGGNRTETSLIWLAGSLYGRDFQHVMILLPWTLVCLLACLFLLRPISTLQLDSNSARALGLNLKKWRLISIFIAICFTASALCVTGPLGFIGLIIPHLCRVILNKLGLATSVGHLALQCLLFGGSLTLAADILSRTLFAPIEIPTGTLTTLLGIPILLFLIRRQR